MISIVVPIYNGEKYIEDCIESILKQTYSDWELILIDNASTDDSYEICKEFADRDDRIQVFHQYRNVGVSAARNLGIEKSKGEFVTFIDADDWVETDYLERLLAIQKKKKADLVICEYQKAYDKDREILRNRFGNKKVFMKSAKSNADGCAEQERKKCQLKVYDVKEYLEKYFLKGNTHCWGVLFTREALSGIYFPKGITIGEDMLFLMDVVWEARTIVVTNYKGYYYYINESGAMKKKFTSSYMDQITCWEKALEKMKEEYPELIVIVESILVVSVLLVVGKLAELSKNERKQYIEEEKSCYESLKKYSEKKEIRKFLPSGYPLKVFVYKHFPNVYVFLYGKLR